MKVISVKSVISCTILVLLVACNDPTGAQLQQVREQKDEKNYFPSMASVEYKKMHPKLCGTFVKSRERFLFDELSNVNNEESKAEKFLLHAAVCNDINGNYNAAIRDATSIVYMSDINGNRTDEYEIALSLIATHSITESDLKAWAYYKLDQNELFLRDGRERDAAENSIKLKGNRMMMSSHFYKKRFEELADAK